MPFFQKILGALYLHLPWKLKPTWHHLWADQSSAGGFGAQEDVRPESPGTGVHSSCPQAPAWTSHIFTSSSCPPSSTSSACTVCQQQAGSTAAAAAAVPTEGKLLVLGSWLVMSWNMHAPCVCVYIWRKLVMKIFDALMLFLIYLICKVHVSFVWSAIKLVVYFFSPSQRKTKRETSLVGLIGGNVVQLWF